jgi:2-hydroxy-6-oxonona-2,4-dienedioate hydrolase
MNEVPPGRRGPQAGAPCKSVWFGSGRWLVHTRVLGSSARDTPRPLVLVTGLGMSGQDMMPLARSLAGHFCVYIPDNIGFGESSKPDHALDIAELGRALAGWMRSAALKDVGVFANSLGCQIAAELALAAPDRVARMVLQAPTADPQARTATQQLARWLRNGVEEPFTGKAMAADYRSAGLRRVASTFRHMLHHRLEDRLTKIDMPVLVVRGGRDPICPQPWAEEVARLLPQGRLVVVPDAAHSIHRFAVPRLSEIIIPFLAA